MAQSIPESQEPILPLKLPGGSGVLALGLLPQFLPYPAGDFRKHMLEHLTIGMIAPSGSSWRLQ